MKLEFKIFEEKSYVRWSKKRGWRFVEQSLALLQGALLHKTESLVLLSTSNESCNTGWKRDGHGTDRYSTINALQPERIISVSLEIGKTLSCTVARLVRLSRFLSLSLERADKWLKFATMTLQAPNEIKEARPQRVNIWMGLVNRLCQPKGP